MQEMKTETLGGVFRNVIIHQNATDANVPLASAHGYPDTATGVFGVELVYKCGVCAPVERVVARDVVVVLPR